METTIKISIPSKENTAVASSVRNAMKCGLPDIIEAHLEKTLYNKGITAPIRKIFEIGIQIISAQSIGVSAILRTHLLKYGYCEVTFWMDDQFKLDENPDMQFAKVFGLKEI